MAYNEFEQIKKTTEKIHALEKQLDEQLHHYQYLYDLTEHSKRKEQHRKKIALILETFTFCRTLQEVVEPLNHFKLMKRGKKQ